MSGLSQTVFSSENVVESVTSGEIDDSDITNSNINNCTLSNCTIDSTNTFPSFVLTETSTNTVTNKDLSSGTNTFPSTLVTTTGTQTITNKTIDSDNNTITNIVNADIKASAAIDASKIADGSVSNTEFEKLDGISGDIVGTTDTQTLTNKDLSSSTNTFPSSLTPLIYVHGFGKGASANVPAGNYFNTVYGTNDGVAGTRGLRNLFGVPTELSNLKIYGSTSGSTVTIEVQLRTNTATRCTFNNLTCASGSWGTGATVNTGTDSADVGEALHLYLNSYVSGSTANIVLYLVGEIQ